MNVTHGANFNRTESVAPPRRDGGHGGSVITGAKKAPTCGAFCLLSSLGRRSFLVHAPVHAARFDSLCRQFFPYRGGAVADLVNRLLKFFLRHLQMLGPVLNLQGIMHIDLRAVVALVFSALVFEALGFVLLMKSKPENQSQASLFLSVF
jgi:hypothetical protein